MIENDALRYTLIIIITLSISSITSLILRKIIKIFTTRFAVRLKADPTHFSFIKNSVTFVIFCIAFVVIFLSIPPLRKFGAALFAGAGILAAIIGFAAQKAFSNIISGIFILMFKPFRVGDTIEVGTGNKGVVEEITLRHIVIKDYENRRIIIPNTIISDETIVNSSISDEVIRKHIEFGIGYKADVEKASKIIREEALKHELLIDNRTEEQIEKNTPVVLIRMISWNDYSITLKAYIWTKNNDDAFVLKCDLLESVKKRFEAEGVEIPYPYQNVILHK